MKLITRDIINKNLKVKSFNDKDLLVKIDEYSYDDIIKGIDQAKTLLHNLGLRAGDKILLTTNTWPEYLVWFFSGAELGLSFLVSDYPDIDEKHLVERHLELYGEIKLHIGDKRSVVKDHLPSLKNKFLDFQEYKYVVESDYKDVIINDKNLPLVTCTSSGTTGIPKIVNHSHEFFYNLLHRNAKIYNLNPTDKCLHTKGLHHGSVTGVYFLPTIKYCENHFYAKHREHDNAEQAKQQINNWIVVKNFWASCIHKENLNRALMFYDMIDVFNEVTSLESNVTNNLDLFVLSPVKESVYEHLIGKRGYNIHSVFGCSETSGPLFLPCFNKENYLKKPRNNFGQPLDNFYKFKLNDEILTVEMPDGSNIETGDKFKIENENWIFYGRENVYRINGNSIYLDLLIDVVEKHLKTKHMDVFDIVIDGKFNQIYLRTDYTIDLDSLNSVVKIILNKNYCFSKQIIKRRKDCIRGIKFDAEYIRLLGREK